MVEPRRRPSGNPIRPGQSFPDETQRLIELPARVQDWEMETNESGSTLTEIRQSATTSTNASQVEPQSPSMTPSQSSTAASGPEHDAMIDLENEPEENSLMTPTAGKSRSSPTISSKDQSNSITAAKSRSNSITNTSKTTGRKGISGGNQGRRSKSMVNESKKGHKKNVSGSSDSFVEPTNLTSPSSKSGPRRSERKSVTETKNKVRQSLSLPPENEEEEEGEEKEKEEEEDEEEVEVPDSVSRRRTYKKSATQNNTSRKRKAQSSPLQNQKRKQRQKSPAVDEENEEEEVARLKKAGQKTTRKNKPANDLASLEKNWKVDETGKEVKVSFPIFSKSTKEKQSLSGHELLKDLSVDTKRLIDELLNNDENPFSKIASNQLFKDVNITLQIGKDDDELTSNEELTTPEVVKKKYSDNSTQYEAPKESQTSVSEFSSGVQACSNQDDIQTKPSTQPRDVNCPTHQQQQVQQLPLPQQQQQLHQQQSQQQWQQQYHNLVMSQIQLQQQLQNVQAGMMQLNQTGVPGYGNMFQQSFVPQTSLFMPTSIPSTPLNPFVNNGYNPTNQMIHQQNITHSNGLPIVTQNCGNGPNQNLS